MKTCSRDPRFPVWRLFCRNLVSSGSVLESKISCSCLQKKWCYLHLLIASSHGTITRKLALTPHGRITCDAARHSPRTLKKRQTSTVLPDPTFKFSLIPRDFGPHQALILHGLMYSLSHALSCLRLYNTYELEGGFMLNDSIWFQNGSLGDMISVEQNLMRSSFEPSSEYLLIATPIFWNTEIFI